MGTLVHSTLHFMFQRDPLFPTLDEVIQHFRERWPVLELFNKESDADFQKAAWSEEDRSAYFEQGVKMLKSFYEKNAPWNYHIVDLESRFELPLADEKTGKSHIVAGIIDRIDKLADEKYEIIDYKTARKMPAQDAINTNLQLALYALGIKNRWPQLQSNEIKLSLYFLKHGQKLGTTASDDLMEKTKAHFLKVIAEIEQHTASGKSFDPMPSALCNWCGYRPMCPAWRHLYKKQKGEQVPSEQEAEQAVDDYFVLQKEKKSAEEQMKKLQERIKAFMEQEGITRVFGAAGSIAKKNQQRFSYDLTRVKDILAPYGKWEEILKADEVKLKKILKEIPQEAREAIAEARTLAKEYVILTTSRNKSGIIANNKSGETLGEDETAIS